MSLFLVVDRSLIPPISVDQLGSLNLFLAISASACSQRSDNQIFYIIYTILRSTKGFL